MNSSLPAGVPLNDLLALSVPEKIAIIGALWDSIEDVPNSPLPQWQIDELERRDAADELSPEPTVTWEEAQQQVREIHARSRSA